MRSLYNMPAKIGQYMFFFLLKCSLSIKNKAIYDSFTLTNLEVVWQFLSPSVARVHGDEHSAGGVQGYLSALKHEPLHPLVDGHLDAVDLLGYHR